MVEALLVAGAFGFSYLGWAQLAARQQPHFCAMSAQRGRQDCPRALQARLLHRGSASLCAGYGSSWFAAGPSFGTLLWIFALACAGIAVTFTLTWRPHSLRCLLGSGVDRETG
jgi:hypothetical protein